MESIAKTNPKVIFISRTCIGPYETTLEYQQRIDYGAKKIGGHWLINFDEFDSVMNSLGYKITLNEFIDQKPGNNTGYANLQKRYNLVYENHN